LSLKSSALAVVRRFQSETDAIREAREPLVARMTLFALSGLIAILVAISFLAHIDRVVTSSQGKIVTTSETLKVFQALDTSLIKSIDVREGDQVKEGQLLATLDQTFANADVSQYKLQVASLDENNQPVTPYYKAH
jgi:hemolysin D